MQKKVSDRDEYIFLVDCAFIEELLRLLLIYKFIFSKKFLELTVKKRKDVIGYVRNVSFNHTIHIALLMCSVDGMLYKDLISLKNRRNDFIHGFLVLPKNVRYSDVHKLTNRIVNKLYVKYIYYIKKVFKILKS